MSGHTYPTGSVIAQISIENETQIRELIRYTTPSFQVDPKIVAGVLVIIFLVIIYYASTILFTRLLKKRAGKAFNTFMLFWKITFAFLILLFAILTFSGNLTALGISVGLLGAMLGWVLQKPILGVAAWFMVMLRKPFRIGDRVAIGDLKGDVTDITLTHVHLNESGGTIAEDDLSGREILIPIYTLFDASIINYTKLSPYIIDEVTVKVAHESDLEKVKKVCIETTKKATKHVLRDHEKFEVPTVRVVFQKDGVDLKFRYQTLAKERSRIANNVREAIFSRLSKEKSVKIVSII